MGVAWEYSEVFILGVVIQTWQIEEVSKTFVNWYCRHFDEIFQYLAYYDFIKPEDARCYVRTAHIRSGTFAMLGAVLILIFLTTFVTKATIQYLREKDEQYYDISIMNRNNNCNDNNNNNNFVDTKDNKIHHHSHDYPHNRREQKNDDDEEELKQRLPVMFTDTFFWALRRA